MPSPTQRSLKYLRDLGYTAEVTEHWNAFTKRRHDLFGFVDIVAVKDTLVAVQTTSGTNVSARIAKITGDEKVRPKALAWLAAGGEIHVHGWAVKGARGKRKKYEVRVVVLDAIVFREKGVDAKRQGVQDAGVVDEIDPKERTDDEV